MDPELAKLQGTWRITSLEVEGAAMPPGMIGGAKILVAGNLFSTEGMGAPFKGTMHIDASHPPT